MNRPRPIPRCLSVLLALSATVTVLIAAAPAAHAANTCTAYADNVHASSHEPGRMNAIGRVECNFDPPGYLYLDAQVQYLSGSTWLASTGWTTTLLTDTPTMVRKSLSHTCVGNGAFTVRRLIVRYGIGTSRATATWTSWKAGTGSTVNCGSGGGGGGGSWANPTGSTT